MNDEQKITKMYGKKWTAFFSLIISIVGQSYFFGILFMNGKKLRKMYTFYLKVRRVQFLIY